MKVIINKKEMELKEGTTIEHVLEMQQGKAFAVWVNKEQLLNSSYSSYCLKEGDVVKIIHILGGG